jgi:cation diffusion facilitator family transporter
MHTHSLRPWQHDHVFGQERRRTGERRTMAVTLLTALTMAVEIVAGMAFGSMALLADGLHMASHAAALGLAVVAYVYARRHADDTRFTFGTGKVDALAGYSSAILLVVFASMMVVESGVRLVHPVSIAFDEAIVVACLGLVVNVASMALLSSPDAHMDASAHADDHAHPHGHIPEHTHAASHTERDVTSHRHHSHAHHDHNLRGAYLHVLADALTSVLAIVALLVAKFWGLLWADPVIAILGAALVARWAWGLIRASSSTLLDREASHTVRDQIRRAIETVDDVRIADLHVWSIGAQGYAAALSVVTSHPRPPEAYRARIPSAARVVHATIEVHHCAQ